MQKINTSIDVSKIDKNKIKERKFTKKDGTEVTEKNYRFNVIERKERKIILGLSNDKYDVYETHFVAEEQSQAEKDTKAPTKYIGRGIQFVNKNNNKTTYDSSPF